MTQCLVHFKAKIYSFLCISINLFRADDTTTMAPFTPLSKEVSIIPNGIFFYLEIFPSQKVQAVICPLFLAAAQVQSTALMTRGAIAQEVKICP